MDGGGIIKKLFTVLQCLLFGLAAAGMFGISLVSFGNRSIFIYAISASIYQ